jgi:predicted alpha/beta-fold hydrolase
MTLKSMAREASVQDIFPTFHAGVPWWGGRLQTVAGALPTTRRRDVDQYPSERLFALVQDGTGDRLVATLHRPISSDVTRCLVMLIHGVSGSEDSSYILRSAVYFLNLGYPVLRANLRGAGPSGPLCKLQYNAGTTDDLIHLVSMVPADLRSNGIVAIGYSLGANLLMKFLGERGSSSPIKASIAVSSPLNLAAVSRRLMQWDNALFQFAILSQLKRESMKPAAELSKRERDAVLSARTLWDFDETFTAPRGGFSGAEDYYARSSCIQFLEHIAVPTLMIYASDDPIVPNDAYHQYRWDKNPTLILLLSKSGGHVGFREANCHAYWHDVCAARFLENIAQI